MITDECVGKGRTYKWALKKIDNQRDDWEVVVGVHKKRQPCCNRRTDDDEVAVNGTGCGLRKHRLQRSQQQWHLPNRWLTGPPAESR